MTIPDEKRTFRQRINEFLKYNPVVEQTDINTIKTSISSSFSGMFLTMLSIVQGVALSLLVLNFPVKLAGWQSIEFEKLLMCIITLLVIIILWHSYFWLAVIARWTPLIWDSLIMFIIGAIELIAVRSIGNHLWYYALGILGIIGGLQYFYNAVRLPDKSWKDERAKKLGDWLQKYKRKRGLALIIISAVALIFTGFAHKFPVLKWVVITIFAFGQVFAIVQHLNDQRETLEEKIGTINI